MVQQCFRRTEILEGIHAGEGPRSKTGDYTDVVVKTPTQRIPWTNLSRISQGEMKQLMREAVDKTHAVLRMLLDKDRGEELLKFLQSQDLVSEWDKPQERKLSFRKLKR